MADEEKKELNTEEAAKIEKELHAEIDKNAEEAEKKARDESAKVSIKEGSAASVMGGLADNYMSPFAVAMQATPMQISALTAFPNLIAPLSQLLTPKAMEKRSRKSIVRIAVLLQALMLIPILITGFLFMYNFKLAVLLFLFFFVLYAFFANFGGPAWSSWMGDLINPKIRGAYFGRRNMICGLVTLISILLGGIFLQYSKKIGYVFFGFAIMFFVAMIFRSISYWFLKKQYEPEFKPQAGYYFSFFQFVKNMGKNNFGRFVLYITLLVMATNISGPFFTPYVLRDLKFSYLTYMIIMLAIPHVLTIITHPLWGKLVDRYGSIKIMRMTWIFVSILPILWLFSANTLYIAFVPQVTSAIAWAGFNLAVSNFIYDAVTPQRRSLCFAYYAVLNGFGVFVGATAGGLIAKYTSISFMNIFLFLFLISGILRIIVSIIMLPRIKEVRAVDSRPIFRFPYLMHPHFITHEQVNVPSPTLKEQKEIEAEKKKLEEQKNKEEQKKEEEQKRAEQQKEQKKEEEKRKAEEQNIK